MTDTKAPPTEMTLDERSVLFIIEVLDGRGYVLDTGTELGHGGMSIVWKGTRKVDGVDVAVKVYLDPEHRDLYEAEVSALNSLGDFPSVIRLFGHGIGEKRWQDESVTLIPYLVMELAQSTLADELKRSGPMSAPQVARVIRSIADALGEVHKLGLVHQDVKPSNIFLVDDRWKLADFNIGRWDRTLKAGTRNRMDPRLKQMIALDPGPGRDIYLLGLTLLEALTGAEPGESKGRDETLKKLPEPLKAIYLGCVDPSLKYRYALARDVAADFEAFVDRGDHPSRVPVLPRAERAFRLARAHPFLTAQAALILAFCSIYGSWLHYDHLRWVQDWAVIQGLKTNANEALEHAKKPSGLLDRPLEGYTVSGVEQRRIDEMRETGRVQVELAHEWSTNGKKLVAHLGRRTDSSVLALSDEFERMNRACLELIEHYKVQNEDRLILDELEAVRLGHAQSLRLVRNGFRFDYLDSTKKYAKIFRDRLGLDTSQKPFDLKSHSDRLSQRPARRMYAVYLVDFMFCWGRSQAESLTRGEFLRLLNLGEENRRVQSIRMLAAKIDDPDPWTHEFHQLFLLIKPESIVRHVKELVADPNLESKSIPPPKMSLLAEVLLESDTKAAIELLKPLHLKNPNDFWINHLLAEAYSDLKDPRELQHRVVAQNEHQGSAVAKFLLGLAYYRVGSKGYAKTLIDEATHQEQSLTAFVPQF